MKLFRCTNELCDAGDFEAAEALCAKCKAGAGLVHEIVPVHYLVPADGPIQTAIGPRMIACNPKMARLPQSATGERVAVTCLKCKGSTIFKEDAEAGTDNHVPVIEQKIAREHNLRGVAQG